MGECSSEHITRKPFSYCLIENGLDAVHPPHPPGPDSHLHSVITHTFARRLVGIFSVCPAEVLKQSLIEVHFIYIYPSFRRQFLNAGKHVLVKATHDTVLGGS